MVFMARTHSLSMLIVVLLETCLMAPNVVAASPAPPTAAAVYDQLEYVLAEGDMDAFAGYIEGLKRDYPGYVPTRLASIFLDTIDGALSEQVAADLTALSEELEPLLPWVSPSFEAGMRDKIRYYTDLAKLLEAEGIKRDGTLRRPQVLDASLCDLGLLVQILGAPEILLPVEGGNRPRPLKLEPVEGEVNEMDYGEALAIAQPPSEASQSQQRAAFAVIGASKRPEAIEELCAIIKAPYAVSPERAAEAVSGFGEAAVPALLDLLRQPEVRGDDYTKKLIVWALVRTGVHRGDVRDAVEQEGKSPSMRNYVERALPYL